MNTNINSQASQLSKRRNLLTILLIFLLLCIMTVSATTIYLFTDPITKPNTYTADTKQTEIVTNNSPFTLNLLAHNVYVVDLTTHSTLYEKNSEKEIAPASTTKLITALTVLDVCKKSDIVTVGDELSYVAADASRANLELGNQLTVTQLLEALLLPSGNDAAYVLAAYTGRKLSSSADISTQEAIQTFITEMNKKAAFLGATNTHFLSPDGYDADGQYTTAKDLSIFASACLQNEILQPIMKSHKVSETLISGEDVYYTNTNELLNPDSTFFNKNVIGLKTGSSDHAGYCVISAATENGHTYLCVVMNSSKKGRFVDSQKIYEAIKEKE